MRQKIRIKKILIITCLFCLWAYQANAQRIFERGLAEMIGDAQNTGKMLALHKTLPVGTSLLVRNSTNGRTVVVKIIGRLPKTGANEKLILKISQSAYQALNASGKRFAVEITNAPQQQKISHTVEQGETLYSIAKKYKVEVEDIKSWNKLENSALSKGQKLTIYKK
jgi:rare lipoprotein A (peptidoglycan hydrolase)